MEEALFWSENALVQVVAGTEHQVYFGVQIAMENSY
jgi:hypothetical protein